ncbi:hypothetical protein [Cupriavidus sp. RAF12]|uniref:hypothetical protein n=1 Tax=Cupriavidus sp. RAF12 TaxID=3233050 RepID=UPI003F8EA5FE
MTPSRARIMRTGSAGGKIVAAFGLTLALAAMSALPAFGADNHYGRASPEQNARNHEGPHGTYYQNSHRNQHNTYYRGGSSYYHGLYRDPYVYAPPPVTYVPEPTPGITLLFPLQFR